MVEMVDFLFPGGCLSGGTVPLEKNEARQLQNLIIPGNGFVVSDQNDFVLQVALASLFSSGSTGVVLVVLVCLVSVLFLLNVRRVRCIESVGRWCDGMMEDVSVGVRCVFLLRARRVGR